MKVKASTEKKPKMTTTQRVEEIALNEIRMCAYQRNTHDRQVANIVAAFDEAKLGMPVVSCRDGHYYLLDGNHRVSALRMLNYTSAKFIVLTGLSYKDEAEYFRAQNNNVRPLSRYILFRAGLEAQDELCVNIERIVTGHGYKISGSARDANAIAAIYTLEVVASVYGCEVLNDTLALIRGTWDGVKNATSREFIAGVAEFVKQFGARDFASRMQNKRIATIWQDYLAACPSGKRSANDPAMRKAFCRVLVEHYNRGFGPTSKKRLKMGESA
jgi:hypothetical protein